MALEPLKRGADDLVIGTAFQALPAGERAPAEPPYSLNLYLRRKPHIRGSLVFCASKPKEL